MGSRWRRNTLHAVHRKYIAVPQRRFNGVWRKIGGPEGPVCHQWKSYALCRSSLQWKTERYHVKRRPDISTDGGDEPNSATCGIERHTLPGGVKSPYPPLSTGSTVASVPPGAYIHTSGSPLKSSIYETVWIGIMGLTNFFYVVYKNGERYTKMRRTVKWMYGDILVSTDLHRLWSHIQKL